MRKLTTFFLALLLLISACSILFTFGCSSDDNSTNPTDPGNPNAVVLFSDGFEAGLAQWSNLPSQHTDTSSYQWRFDGGSIGGISTKIDVGSVQVTAAYASEGSKSLLFEAKNGLYATFTYTGGGTYSEYKCESWYKSQRAQVIRKFSLEDYAAGDKVTFSLSVMPIEITKSATFTESSFGLDVAVYGANRMLKDTTLDFNYLHGNAGKWNDISLDLSQYTEWVSDMSVWVELVPSQVDDPSSGGRYCWSFCYSPYYPTCNNKDYGDSSKCVVAVDDVKLEVIPAP